MEMRVWTQWDPLFQVFSSVRRNREGKTAYDKQISDEPNECSYCKQIANIVGNP